MLAIIAVTWPDLQTMMTSLVENIQPLEWLVEALAYLAGMLIGLRAVYHLKEYGELRTMMSAQTNILKPMLMFIISSVLLYLPTMYHVSLETFFAQSYATPLAYDSRSYESWYGLVSVIVRIVQLVGLIAFIRGWMMMTGLAGHGGTPHGTFGKAMTHIIGGIFAMNIVGTTHVLESTLSIQW